MKQKLAVVAVALAIVVPQLGTAPARAGSTCSYDGSSIVTVVADGPTPQTISTSSGAILFDGVACSGSTAPTVTNTDTIEVTVDLGAQLIIDEVGGPFAPGKTDEGDGSSEIEFNVSVVSGHVFVQAGSANDHIVVGAGAVGETLVNLNADEAVGDADVDITGGDFLVVGGGGGNDTISLGGDTWSTGPDALQTYLDGSSGNDTLSLAEDGGTIDGGTGNDTLDCSWVAGGVDVSLKDHTGLSLDPGAIQDKVSAIEDVVGSPAADVLGGNAGANHLQGGDGDDTLTGYLGGDHLDGGAGLDLAVFASATHRISADLTLGTATGEGTDTLTGIEDLAGSPKDDRLVGDGADNSLSGDRGDDTLLGRGGDDHLYGQAGDDYLNGGSGTNVCRGGPGANRYRNCA